MNPQQIAIFEKTLVRLERKLEELSGPLLARDPDGIAKASAELQHALVESAEVFRLVKTCPEVPAALVQRLRAAFARVISLRESLNRMTASIDRALEVLIPKSAAAVYGRYQSPSARMAGRFASYNA